MPKNRNFFEKVPKKRKKIGNFPEIWELQVTQNYVKIHSNMFYLASKIILMLYFQKYGFRDKKVFSDIRDKNPLL